MKITDILYSKIHGDLYLSVNLEFRENCRKLMTALMNQNASLTMAYQLHVINKEI